MEKANESIRINTDVDIIIPWVDSSDPEWIKQYKESMQRYCPDKEAVSDIRFQNWDNLKYLFRAINMYMPWYNRIFFITYGHVPEWMNVDNDRIVVVKHKDYIPDEYLPTFNSNTIEMNYFRIKNLSENFIIFNDDMFPLQSIEKQYYFKENIVCDEAVENIVVTAGFGSVANMARYTQINNMMIINKYFKKREVQMKFPDIWFNEAYEERLERTESLKYWNDFCGFYDPHLPSAMKKSVLKMLWNNEYCSLDRASRNHFRAYNDLTQYLVRYWQICSGNIVPRKTRGKVFFVDRHNYKDIADIILNHKYQMICINENCTDDEFVMIKEEINNAFNNILPDKCLLER